MCAVTNIAVFSSYMISRFPGVLLRYFLNDFEMAPVAPIITGIISVFTFHLLYISIVRFRPIIQNLIGFVLDLFPLS